MDKPKPLAEFGRRKPQPPAAPEAPKPKRSRHVALLLAGTVAVGGGAYALMPPENCTPGAAASPGQTACAPRSSSSSGGGSGGHGSYGGSSGRSAVVADVSSNSSSSTSEGTTRGGFGSFARALGSHFSFGG